MLATDLMEGIHLMLLGMAGVFSFLALLVAAMLCSGVFFRNFGDLFPEEGAMPNVESVPVTESNVDIAVAIAAVNAYTRG